MEGRLVAPIDVLLSSRHSSLQSRSTNVEDVNKSKVRSFCWGGDLIIDLTSSPSDSDRPELRLRNETYEINVWSICHFGMGTLNDNSPKQKSTSHHKYDKTCFSTCATSLNFKQWYNLNVRLAVKIYKVHWIDERVGDKMNNDQKVDWSALRYFLISLPTNNARFDDDCVRIFLSTWAC